MGSIPVPNEATPNGNSKLNGNSQTGLGTCGNGVSEDKAGFCETTFTTDDTSVLITPEDLTTAPKPVTYFVPVSHYIYASCY